MKSITVGQLTQVKTNQEVTDDPVYFSHAGAVLLSQWQASTPRRPLPLRKLSRKRRRGLSFAVFFPETDPTQAEGGADQ